MSKSSVSFLLGMTLSSESESGERRQDREGSVSAAPQALSLLFEPGAVLSLFMGSCPLGRCPWVRAPHRALAQEFVSG